MSRKKSMFILFSIVLLAFVLLMTVMDGTEPKTLPSSQLTSRNGVDPLNLIKDTDEKSTVLKVSVSMEPEEFKLLQSYSQSYEFIHYGLSVEFENLPVSEVYRIFMSRSQLGTGADIMLLDNIWINEFAAMGLLSHRMDEFFSSEMQSQQIEAMMSQVKWNGYIWAVPLTIDPYVIVWNKQRFAEKNADTPPASAEKLIALNHLFREPEQGKYGLYLDPADPLSFISLVWSLGGAPASTNNSSIFTIDANTQKLLESLFNSKVSQGEATETPRAQETAAASSETTVKTTPKRTSAAEETQTPTDKQEAAIFLDSYPDDAQNAWNMLRQGKIAMMITRASAFSKNEDGNLAIAPLPHHAQSDRSSWLAGRSFAVSSHSANASEAFKWIQKMTTEDIQISIADTGNGFPAVSSAYHAAKLNSIKQISAITRAIDQEKVLSVEPLLPDKLSILQNEMTNLFTGKLSINRFLDQVNKRWLELEKK